MSAPLTTFRAAIEAMVQAGIDLLDEIDAPAADREPDAELEIVSEDEGVVRPWPSRALRGGSDEA
jgi:hypothetical protein